MAPCASGLIPRRIGAVSQIPPAPFVCVLVVIAPLVRLPSSTVDAKVLTGRTASAPDLRVGSVVAEHRRRPFCADCDTRRWGTGDLSSRWIPLA